MLTQQRTAEGREEGEGCEDWRGRGQDPSALGDPHLSCLHEIAACPSIGPKRLLEGTLRVSLVVLDWADGCLP